MAPGQQASAVDMAVEGAEDNEEEGLEAATSTEAAGVADMAMTTRTTDAVADGSTASVIFARRAVEEGVQKFFDLLTRLEGADLNYSELQKKTKLLALLP
ncbi:unnamed protein product, partial [Closterium sp. NIES-53]